MDDAGRGGTRLAVFAFSRRGMDTARRIVCALEDAECRLYAAKRLAEGAFAPVEGPLADFTGPIFRREDALVFVSSCGVAVRAVAPHVRSKNDDPAVIAVDETARFAIPLLSGHIGGANRLAERLADALGAEAVVTTATDANGRFSVDAWAAERGLCIDGLPEAKAVSAAILEGDVPLKSDFPLAGSLPPGVTAGEAGPVGICVSWRRQSPFEKTLLLAPPVVRLGVGCRRGTAAETIAAVVREALDRHGVHPRAVKCAASIDLKRDEPGLLAFAEEAGLPLEFYSAGELEKIEGSFSPSAFVKRVTGVDNVCERAAMVGAEKLIVKKTAGDGVTVAAAVEHWEVRFG